MINLQEPNDEKLVEGCLGGDKRSWDVFVERFSKLIHWSVRKTLEGTPYHDRQELREDIFQEIFKRLIEREQLARLREVTSLRKYLAVTACHMTIRRLRNLQSRENQALGRDPDAREDLEPGLLPAQDPGEAAAAREDRAVLLEALDELTTRERSCLEFHYMDGKTHRQISELLGLPQDTVSTIIRRTRQKLKVALDGNTGI